MMRVRAVAGSTRRHIRPGGVGEGEGIIKVLWMAAGRAPILPRGKPD